MSFTTLCTDVMYEILNNLDYDTLLLLRSVNKHLYTTVNEFITQSKEINVIMPYKHSYNESDLYTNINRDKLLHVFIYRQLQHVPQHNIIGDLAIKHLIQISEIKPRMDIYGKLFENNNNVVINKLLVYGNPEHYQHFDFIKIMKPKQYEIQFEFNESYCKYSDQTFVRLFYVSLQRLNEVIEVDINIDFNCNNINLSMFENMCKLRKLRLNEVLNISGFNKYIEHLIIHQSFDMRNAINFANFDCPNLKTLELIEGNYIGFKYLPDSLENLIFNNVKYMVEFEHIKPLKIFSWKSHFNNVKVFEKLHLLTAKIDYIEIYGLALPVLNGCFNNCFKVTIVIYDIKSIVNSFKNTYQLSLYSFNPVNIKIDKKSLACRQHLENVTFI